MKNTINKISNAKFDQKIFNMSKIEFEIVGLFEEHVVNDEVDKLWVKLLDIFKNNELICSIINLYKKGAISMIECESLILLFARHQPSIWNELSDVEKTTTDFRAPIELVNNILNISYEPLKLGVSELKFLTKIIRLNNKTTYNQFFDLDMSSFKNLLIIKTFFMKRSILESYTEAEYDENISDLKIKTVKDLICHFIQMKTKKIN